ncbi:MAG: hypothetical protein MHM6MM_001036 [Cercozoa sp. M6MM]
MSRPGTRVYCVRCSQPFLCDVAPETTAAVCPNPSCGGQVTPLRQRGLGVCGYCHEPLLFSPFNLNTTCQNCMCSTDPRSYLGHYRLIDTGHLKTQTVQNGETPSLSQFVQLQRVQQRVPQPQQFAIPEASAKCPTCGKLVPKAQLRRHINDHYEGEEIKRENQLRQLDDAPLVFRLPRVDEVPPQKCPRGKYFEPGEWTCQSCETVNDAKRNSCETCEKMREQTSAELAKDEEQQKLLSALVAQQVAFVKTRQLPQVEANEFVRRAFFSRPRFNRFVQVGTGGYNYEPDSWQGLRDLEEIEVEDDDSSDEEEYSDLGEDSEEQTDVRVEAGCLPLNCSISQRRPVVAVRTVRCQHVRCFDLESYLVQSQTEKSETARWRCPDCRVPANLTELYVCPFVSAVARELDENERLTQATRVFVDPQLTWKIHKDDVPKPEQNVIDLTAEDSDDDYDGVYERLRVKSEPADD